jgi:predicted RNA-binding Zn ribbon-like protein
MTFAFVSGDVALDLTSTVHHRRTDATELLAAPDDLARWLTEARVVDTRVKVAPADFTGALRLREAVYRLAIAARDHGRFDTPDRKLLNRVARGAPVRLKLADDGTVARSGDAASAVATLARCAIELLSGELARSIKECAADECTRLYVDGSRKGGRRWCDMRECGNRAKVASFRARHDTVVTG